MDIAEIRQERDRQDEMWGGKDHDSLHGDHEWVRFIRKRLPELDTCTYLAPERRRELYLHIAALAVAAIEADE